MIEIGDKVNIHFSYSESIFDAIVMYIPHTTGDSWQLKDIHGNEGKEQPLKISFSRSKTFSIQEFPVLNLIFTILSFFTQGTVLDAKLINEPIENCYPCNQK